MAEGTGTPASGGQKEAPNQNEEIKNIKAEFDRKLQNVEKSNAALMAQLQAISQIKQPQKEAPKLPKGQFKDLWYDDPEKAAETVIETAVTKAEERLSKKQEDQQKYQQKQNTVIQGLYKEYPELQDMDNPLTTKAIEHFNKLSVEEQANPIAYRLAVKEAADELEIKPKARRKKDDDTAFTLSDSGPKSASEARKSGKLDPKILQTAQLMGLNIEDPKVIESLKAKNQRTNWMKWE